MKNVSSRTEPSNILNLKLLIVTAGVIVCTLQVIASNNGALDESVSANTVYYNPEILSAFDNQTWVRVIVRLVDNSGINITGTKEERIELMKQRDLWFEPVIDEVLSRLSGDGFEPVRRLSNGFTANSRVYVQTRGDSAYDF